MNASKRVNLGTLFHVNEIVFISRLTLGEAETAWDIQQRIDRLSTCSMHKHIFMVVWRGSHVLNWPAGTQWLWCPCFASWKSRFNPSQWKTLLPLLALTVYRKIPVPVTGTKGITLTVTSIPIGWQIDVDTFTFPGRCLVVKYNSQCISSI
jgi:hypothetical protein